MGWLRKMRDSKVCYLGFMLALFPLFISLVAEAKPVARYDHAKAQYEETSTDMTVKVLGGEVRLKRRYRDGQWMFNPQWRSLRVERVTPDGTASNDQRYPVGRIFRDQYRYKKARLLRPQDNHVARFVYEHDPSKHIIQTTSGFIWADRTGEKIFYDADGDIRGYQNANGVNVTFSRNADGKIDGVHDHFGARVVEIDYQDGHISRLRDYSGRKVTYTWGNNNTLEQATDIDGQVWRYEYVSLLGRQYLAKITDPEENAVALTNTVSQGGVVDVSDQPFGSFTGTGGVRDNRGSVSLRSSSAPGVRNLRADLSRRSIEAEQMVMLTRLTYDDGQYIRYNTYYNLREELYTTVTKTSDGVELQQTFAKDGKLAEISLAGKRLYTQIKSSNRRVIEDGLNHRTEIRYDQWDNPVTVMYADGSSESYSYHPVYNLPVEHRDRRGYLAQYRYDDNGNLVQLIEAVGKPEQRVIRFEYDGYGQLTKLEIAGDANSEAVALQFDYDSYGNISRYTDGRATPWQLKDYTPDGQPQTVIDGRKNAWRYRYTPSGKLTRITTPEGHATDSHWQYHYNKNGDLAAVIDPLNQKTTIAYDPRGHVVSVTDSLGKLAGYQHYLDGRIKRSEDGEGHGQQFAYDRQLRLKSVRDDAGNLTQYSYQGEEQTALAWVSKIRRPEVEMVYEYDRLGQPVKIRQNSLLNSDSLVHQLTYNRSARPEVVQDPAGRVTKAEYDGFNRLITQTDALDGKIDVQYTNLGQVASVTDPANRTTRYEYDAQGNRTAEVLPMGQRFEYDYDANGNLTLFRNANGEVIRYDYDADNRLIKEAWFDGLGNRESLLKASREMTYRYYLNGQLKATNVSHSLGVTATEYTYNVRGEVTEETVHFPDFSKVLSYTYYKNGLPKTVKAPDGNEASYQYDRANRLSVATMKGHGSVVFSAYQGQLPKTMSYPAGLTRQQGYDGFGRLNHIKISDVAGKVIEQIDYRHDEVGNIAGKATLAGRYQYRYDKLDRLTEALQPAPLNNLAFSYDAVGDRKSSRDEPVWDYNANHQLVQKGNAYFRYDGNGNLLTEHQGGLDKPPVKAHHYNTEARLVKVEQQGKALASYDYDVQGRRVARLTKEGNQYFLYTHQGLVGEYDAQGKLVSGYQYPPGATWGTAPWYQKTEQGAGGGFYQNDHLGAPILLLKDSGQPLWQGMYDAFGEVTETTAQTPNNLRFPGQWLDRETGYHYNYFRDYNPQSGRYIQRDPIGLAGGLNTYGYSYQNPLVNTDPKGLLVPQVIGGIVGGGVSAAVMWDDYKCGKISLGQYLTGIGIGAGAGAISAGATVWSGVAISATGTAFQQVVTEGELNVSDIAISGVTAGLGGKIGLWSSKILFPSKYVTTFERRWYTLWLYKHKVITEVYNKTGRESAESAIAGLVGGGASALPSKLPSAGSENCECN